MRPIRTTIALAAALTLGSGCIIVSGGEPVEEADLTVLYTFGGEVLDRFGACSDVGISTIRVRAVGVDVADQKTGNGSCAVFSEGMTLKGLKLGSYDVTVTGMDRDGYAIYDMTSPARAVVGKTGGEIDVDVPSLFGGLSVYWNSFGDFSGSTMCSDAGVHDVRAVLYDSAGNVLSDDYIDCSAQGVFWDLLDTGTYEVVLNGLDAYDYVLYAGEAFVDVAVGEIASYDIDLHPMVGSLTVWWSSFGDFEGSSMCSDASVVEVRAVLLDDSGSVVSDDYLDCAYQGVVWDYLLPGEYEVVLNGLDEYGDVLFAGEAFVDVLLGEDSSYDIDLEMIVGDLTILWRFDGDTSCGAVTQIQVHLYDPWDEVFDSAVYECVDHGGLTYDNVQAGEWLVYLEAEDETGSIIYRTYGDWILSVVAGEVNEYYVDLE